MKASQDASFWTSLGGISGRDPSAGNATRLGPTAPRWRYADDAPGPPLNTNVNGRGSSVSATYATEKISAAGLSFLRRTNQRAVAVYASGVSPPVHVALVSAPAGGSWSGIGAFGSCVSSLIRRTLPEGAGEAGASGAA